CRRHSGTSTEREVVTAGGAIRAQARRPDQRTSSGIRQHVVDPRCRIIYFLPTGARAYWDVATSQPQWRTTSPRRAGSGQNRRAARGRLDLLRTDSHVPNPRLDVAAPYGSRRGQQYVLV